MAWLTWRQHRLEGTIAAAALALVGLLLLLTGLRAYSAFDAAGLGTCLSDGSHHCVLAVDQFQERFASFDVLSGWLNLLPGLIGVLLAAPLVLDLDQGTYRLVWTQGISRGRWLWTQLGLLTVSAVVAGLAISALFTWWRRPFDRIEGRMSPSVFDFQGIVPVAYVLFAIAVALAIGVATRRTAASLAGGFVVYVVVRLSVQQWVRPHYVSPLRVTWTPRGREPAEVSHAWKLSGAIVGRDGHRVADPDALFRACGFNPSPAEATRCFREHGVFNTALYQPADRFWLFQAIEFILFVGIAAALAGGVVWWIRRRLA